MASPPTANAKSSKTLPDTARMKRAASADTPSTKPRIRAASTGTRRRKSRQRTLSLRVRRREKKTNKQKKTRIEPPSDDAVENKPKKQSCPRATASISLGKPPLPRLDHRLAPAASLALALGAILPDGRASAEPKPRSIHRSIERSGVRRRGIHRVLHDEACLDRGGCPTRDGPAGLGDPEPGW